MGSARKFSWLTVRVNFKRRAAAIIALVLLSSGLPLPVASADPLDQQAPTTTVIASPAAPDGEAGWYRTAPEIAFSIDESATTFYQWDSTEASTFQSAPAALSVPGGGTHTLNYYSIDLSANQEDLKSLEIKVDTDAPHNPQISSPSHTTDETSTDRTIEIAITGASDTASGVAGYAASFSRDTTEDPGPAVSLEAGAEATVSAPLSDGVWYFNLATKDTAGNWSGAAHLGPFSVDYQAQNSDPGWRGISLGRACAAKVAIDGDIAAAIDDDWGENLKLFWYDLVAGERHETSITAVNLAVSQGKIAFFELFGSISVLDTSTGDVEITDIATPLPRPDPFLTNSFEPNRWFSGDNIVFVDAMDGYIKVYSVADRTTTNTGQVNGGPGGPEISGDIVTFVNVDGQVVYYSISSGQAHVIGAGSKPVAGGDIVSYIDGGALKYFLVSTSETIDTGISSVVTQSTDGQRIVYAEQLVGASDFHIFDIATGISQESAWSSLCMCVAPDISGDFVAIEHYEGDGPGLDLNGNGARECIGAAVEAARGIDTTASLSGTMGTNGWYTTDVEATLSATDTSQSPIARTQYSFNGKNWTDYTGPFTVATEGDNTLWMRSITEAGKVEMPRRLPIKIDKTGPEISISSPTGKTYNFGTDASAEWSAADGASGVVSSTGTTESGGKLDTTHSGPKTFEVTAVDAAGNQTQATVAYTVADPGWRGISLGRACAAKVAIDGDIAAAIDDDWGENLRLFWYDLVAGERHETSITAVNLAVSQGKIAFFELFGSISVLDTSTGDVDMTDIATPLPRPDPFATNSFEPNRWFSGDNIVFVDAMDGYIKVYSVANRATTNTGQVNGGPGGPQISGDIVTFVNVEGQVVYYSISSGQAHLIGAGSKPVAGGDIISYIDGGALKYFLVSTSETIDTGISSVVTQSTDGQRIVYAEQLVGASDFHIFDIATGISQESAWSSLCMCVAPDISGDFVAIEHYEGDGPGLDLNGNGARECIGAAVEAARGIDTTASLSGTMGDNGWYTTDVEATLSATDTSQSPINRTQYSFNGKNWTDYTGPFTVSREGDSTLWMRSITEAGKVEMAKRLPIKIDKTMPADLNAFQIAGGADEIISLDITIGAIPEAAQMRFAQSVEALEATAYLPYRPSYDLRLQDISTTQTVYAQFKDALGRQSAVVSDTVFYRPQLGSEKFYSVFTKKIGAQTIEVNLASGNLHLANVDLDVAARGISAKIERHYNSLDANEGALSKGWRFNVDSHIEPGGADGAIAYVDADGSRHLFAQSADGAYSAPPGVDLALSGSEIDDGHDRYVFGNVDSGGYLLSTLRAGINSTTFSRAGDGRLTGMTFPSNTTATLDFSGGKLSGLRDSLGRAVAYDYGDGRFTKFTSLGGQKTKYAYAFGKLTQIAGANGTITIGYDSLGRIETITEPQSTEANPIDVSFSYGSGETSVTDAGGHTTAYFYNSRGNTTKIVAPDGSAEEFEWLDNRQIKADAAGGAKTLTYDSSGNVDNTYFAIDNDATGHIRANYQGRDLTQLIDANGTSMSISYSGANPALETDSRGYVRQHTYDNYGNLLAISDWHDPADTTTTYGTTYYTYSANHDYLTGIADTNGGVTTFGYDAGDKSWQQVDPRGYRTSIYYDDNKALSAHAGGRILKIKDAKSLETTYSYDGDGNLSGVKDARGHKSAYRYNAAGLLERFANPLGKATDYLYDGDGNLVGKTDPVAQAVFSYDESGRLVGESHGSGGTTETFNLTYWPGTENIKTAGDSGGGYDFAYNKAGWLTRATDPFGLDQSYAYKPGGQIQSVKVGDDATTTYGYQHNLLTGLTDSGGETTFAYDPRRNLISASRPNNTGVSVAYNKANRPERIVDVLADETLSVTYRYDEAGNTIADAVNGDANRYFYDGLNQLTSWLGPDGTREYAFDAAGNITRKGDTTFTYNEGNQLTSDGANAYTYNDRGDLTSDGVNTYDWNAAGRLQSFSSTEGVTSYTYDYQGRRLTKTTPDGHTIRYHWLNKFLMAESDSSGIIATYAYTDKGRLHSTTRGDQTYYYHLSYRGDVLALTDSTGAVVARYSYDPWGTVLSATGALADQPFRYAGYYLDDESQMYYLVARYYRPAISRFISLDSVPGDPKKPLSFNGYVYADNNPLRYVDSLGTSSKSCGGGSFPDDGPPPHDPAFNPPPGGGGAPAFMEGFAFSGTVTSVRIQDQYGNWVFVPDLLEYYAVAGHQYLAYYDGDFQSDGWFANVSVTDPGGSQISRFFGDYWNDPLFPAVNLQMQNPHQPGPVPGGKYKIRLSASNARFTHGWQSHELKYKGLILHSPGPACCRGKRNGPNDKEANAGDPVMTSTGNFFYDHQDLSLPGKGLSLEFKRSYNSADGLTGGPLGHGWTHNYNTDLVFDSATTVTVNYATGSGVPFGSTDGVNFTPTKGVTEKLVKNTNGTYKLVFADQTKYNFNAEGKLTSQVDRYGNATTMTYTDGLLTKATDPSGRYLAFEYLGQTVGAGYTKTNATFLRKVTDSTSRTISFDYNGAGNLISYTDARGKTTKYKYDDGGHGFAFASGNQLTEITEPGATEPIVKNVYGDFKWLDPYGGTVSSGAGGSGVSTPVCDDPSGCGPQDGCCDSMTGGGGAKAVSGSPFDRIPVNGKVVRQYDANGNQWNYSYNEGAKRTTMTDNKGNTLIHEYDDDFRLIRSIDSSGHASSLAYGPLNKPLTSTNQNDATTTYSYDANGNVTGSLDPEGHGGRALYDLSNNNILWSKDALERQTTYNWDTSGKWLNSLTSPIGTTLFGYYSDGSMKTTTDALGHKTAFQHNAAGNLTKITDSLDDSSTMEYDARGQMTAATDGEGNRSEYAYDAAGNILTISDPLAALYPSERHQDDMTYDDKGNLASFRDANGNLTSFTYDGENSLASVVDSMESTTYYGYDPNYYIAWVKDAEGRTTHYDNDANNRLKSITDSLGATTTFEHDPAGNLTKVAYPNGNETYSDYNKDGLITALAYKNEEASYTFEYNAVHAPTKVTGRLGGENALNWLFGYDAGDRLTTTTEAVNASIGDYAIARAYDAADNLIGIKPSADASTAYDYNARYDLTGIDLPGGETTEIVFGYNKARKLTRTAQPGVLGSIDYDAASRIKCLINETSIAISRYDYGYDANGNMLSAALSNGEASQTTRYGYDVLSRLTAWYNPLFDTTTTYRYDRVGNLLEVKENGVTTKAFEYDAANRIGSTGYEYDDNGNMNADTSKRYEYDSENRLKTVVSKDTSQVIAAYAYDFMGRRISATDSSGSTTYFHYDGWNVLAESDSSGNITANYYYDDNEQVQAMKRDNRMYYYQFNAHGDVVSLTDSSGSIVNSYEYDPWGNPLVTSETVANPFRYAGYRYDSNTNLYYLRNRYYSPADYRFITKDKELRSIEPKAPLTHNLYAYCVDNPNRYVDPDGTLGRELIAVGVGIDMLDSPLPGPADIPGDVIAGVGVLVLGGELAYQVSQNICFRGAWEAVKNYYFAKEHTKGKRKSTWEKHTKPRPGRESEKKRDQRDWKSNPNKRR